MKKHTTAHKLHTACQQNNLTSVIELLTQPSATRSINTGIGVLGYTPLHEAVSRRLHQVAKVLLKNNADPNVISNG